MSKELSTMQQNFSLIEQVVIKGDLSRLSDVERVCYYKSVCESVGINPLTNPFEYIKLGNKLTLYAKKDCTEQLRKIHGVSIEGLETKVIDDVYIVSAKAKDRNGRTDESTGAVNIANLRGEAKANAIMKAETKAKRRVTLSICGLGWCDETEVETIPGATKVPVNLETGEILDVTPLQQKEAPSPEKPCVNSSESDKLSPQQLQEILGLLDQVDVNCLNNFKAYMSKEFQTQQYAEIPQFGFAACLRGLRSNIEMNKKQKAQA